MSLESKRKSERRQEQKSGASSHSWARPEINLDFLNSQISAPDMISGGLTCSGLEGGLSSQPEIQAWLWQ